MEVSTDKESKESKESKKGDFFALIVIAALLGGVGYYANYKQSPEQVEKREKLLVYEHCKKEVLKKLKSPASAVFPEEMPDLTPSEEGSGYQFTSYVDSQNSYGAIIRSNYSCDAWCYEKQGKDDYCFIPRTLEIN